jgi:hypothetical protein
MAVRRCDTKHIARCSMLRATLEATATGHRHRASTLQCANCCAPQTQLRSTPERDSDASTTIDATPLPVNRPPLASAPSGVPYLPGALAATNPRITPSVQPLMRQSTVSGAVEAGQPAANRENVDGGPTQEMVASELEQPARHLQGWIHHRQT